MNILLENIAPIIIRLSLGTVLFHKFLVIIMLVMSLLMNNNTILYYIPPIGNFVEIHTITGY